MENIRKKIGEVVRRERLLAGYRSIDALSERLGVHSNTLGMLERGEIWISEDMVDKLSEALGRPHEVFLGGSPEPKITPAEAISVLQAAMSRKDYTTSIDLAPAPTGLSDEQRELVRLIPGLDCDETKLLLERVRSFISKRNNARKSRASEP